MSTLARLSHRMGAALLVVGVTVPAVGHAADPKPPGLLEEIQSHFKATKKWFGMVADLPWERAPDGTLTPRLGNQGSKFVLKNDPAGQTLSVRLPPFASGPIEVHLEGQSQISVRTEEDGVAPVPAEVIDGMVVYRGAVQGGDLLYKLTPTHVDEYIYFRSPPPELHREFEFDRGAGVAGLRETGVFIEVLGKDGSARLRLGAPFARAADGTRRNGTVHLRGTRIVEDLDLRGLTPPILVDPDWATTGTMTVAHWADYGFRQSDGSVMSIAGCALASCPLGLATSACNQILASVDIWDPKVGTWKSGSPLLAGRYSFGAVPLSADEVLVAGGCTATGCASTTSTAERYSTMRGTWVEAGALPTPRANLTAALLPGGDALFPGGCDAKQCFADVARYTPSAGKWSSAAALSAPRGYATTTTLADGTVLVIGGCGDAACANVLLDAERYDPKTDTWRSAGAMAKARAGHTATLLDDGTVLVTGGCSTQPCKGTTLQTTEIWQPDELKGGKFVAGPSMNAPRHHHTATRLSSGQVLLAGGTDGTDATRAASEVYMPLSKHFYQAPRMMMSRAYHVGVPLLSGDVLVAGGCNPATCLPWAEVFSATGLPVDTPDGGIPDAGPEDAATDAESDAGTFTVSGGPHPKLFRTGAVSCGNDDTQDLPCPLAGWPAQDGDFQPNIRPMVPSGDSEVQDPRTGLTWQARDDKGTYTQAQAIDRCKSVSPAGSWRLPTVVELMTINDYGKIGPSIDQAFPDTQQTNYWTASAVAGSKMLGWTVKFDAGELVPLLKDTTLPIRCVRGETTTAKAGGDHVRLAGPLTAADDTVRDDANTLEWQRKDDGVKRTWRESLEYCSTLSLGGHHDWHLPNIYELVSLVEFGSADAVKIDPVFQDAKGDLYWSGTFNEGIPTLSWSVTFNLGVVDGVTVSGRALARCVRHLQPPPPPAPKSACGCRVVGGEDRDGRLGGALLTVAVAALVRGTRRRSRTR